MGKPRNRVSRSDAALSAASSMLLHHLVAMDTSTKAYQFVASKPVMFPTVYRNELLVAFVVHFRILLDFYFIGDGARKDDVVAEDFFSSPDEWRSARSVPEFFELERRRANKQIAHLTYETDHDGESNHWDFAKLSNPIFSATETFRRKVRAGLLAENLYHVDCTPRVSTRGSSSDRL